MKKVLFVFYFLFRFFTGESQERYFQLRNINKVTMNLGEATLFSLSERNYYTPQTKINNLALYGDFSGKLDVKNWLELGASGRLIGYRRNDGWIMEQRPIVSIRMSAWLGRFEMKFYNQMEHRILKDIDNYLRHRHILSIEIPPFNFSWLTFFCI